ncbi:unnamed protein product [Malus baccata var. baccata]
MYVVHPDWLRLRNRRVLINCEGFTQVDVAASLEVLFLHPGLVSLTGEDAQGLVKRDTNHVVGVPQVAELGDLLKEVTDKSIRPTEEFEGQNKSIKSRVRSTLLIWDTFAFDRVMDVSAYVLLRLSPHASLYPSHLPYLFLKQMRYLPWKHKMLKMSTREQCQYSLFAEVLSGGKKAEYFERLRWECPLKYEEGLSIFAERCSGSCKLHVLNFGRDFGKVICGTHELLLLVGSG